MDPLEVFLAEISRKNEEGTLTVGQAGFGYLRLREGPHAGKVIIKSGRRIDEKFVATFANSLTWILQEELDDTLCEIAYPKFNEPVHPIDRSQAMWYPDGSNKPMTNSW